MGGSSAPPDRSVELRQLELDAAAAERERQAADEAKRIATFNQNLESARGLAQGSANDYFMSRGLDTANYSDPISREISRIAAGIPDTAANPSTYFDNIGENVYNREQDAARTRYSSQIDQFAPAGFATRRISNDIDDPFLDAILAEQRASADDTVRNMLDRGVITNTGYNAALADLNDQQYGAKARLNEIGLGVLEGGRQNLRDIANDARNTASNYMLGQTFIPSDYSGQIDREFSDFLQNLGGNIRSQVTGNLFDTSGLAGIAGAAQGAQNTAFNPAAAAGIVQNTKDDEEDRTNSSSSIF